MRAHRSTGSTGSWGRRSMRPGTWPPRWAPRRPPHRCIPCCTERAHQQRDEQRVATIGPPHGARGGGTRPLTSGRAAWRRCSLRARRAPSTAPDRAGPAQPCTGAGIGSAEKASRAQRRSSELGSGWGHRRRVSPVFCAVLGRNLDLCGETKTSCRFATTRHVSHISGCW